MTLNHFLHIVFPDYMFSFHLCRGFRYAQVFLFLFVSVLLGFKKETLIIKGLCLGMFLNFIMSFHRYSVFRCAQVRHPEARSNDGSNNVLFYITNIQLLY
jgi:hypothetical protein